MFPDLQTRAQRMKRVPEVMLKDYVKPLGYALVLAPVLYVLMFAYYVVANVLI